MKLIKYIIVIFISIVGSAILYNAFKYVSEMMYSVESGYKILAIFVGSGFIIMGFGFIGSIVVYPVIKIAKEDSIMRQTACVIYFLYFIDTVIVLWDMINGDGWNVIMFIYFVILSGYVYGVSIYGLLKKHDTNVIHKKKLHRKRVDI